MTIETTLKDSLVTSLDEILLMDGTIKNHVDRIHSIREQLDEVMTPDERDEISNKIRAKAQKEALYYWSTNGLSRGAVLMATGSGKSKVGIDAIRLVESTLTNVVIKVLIVVPTEKLRDEGWHEEFCKWGATDIWLHNIVRTCYASLSKFNGQHFDLVILDEGHNLTEHGATFFEHNVVERILWMSATRPRDTIKIELLRRLKIHPAYELTLDECVKLGLVAPYDITVITVKLDTKDKYIRSGSKDKPFYTSEKNNYNYLSQQCFAVPHKIMFLRRMRFIYDLRTKTRAAKWIVDNLIPKKEYRTLIFCGSKKQAMQLSEHHYFSRPSKPKKLVENATAFKVKRYMEQMTEYEDMVAKWQGDESFNAFKEKQIDQMSCCDALNEGHNIPDLDCGFIVQLNSNELNLWQRIGRVIRFKPNHIGKFLIMCAEETEDKKWVETATKNLNGASIRWVSFDDLVSGKETITF